MNTDNVTLAMARANARMTVSLIRHLAAERPHENVFVSPASVSLALALLTLGTGGESRRLLAQMLGVDDLSCHEADAALGTMYHALIEHTDGAAAMRTTNALWSDTTCPLPARFQETAERLLGAEARSMDLNAPEAVDVINQWISDATNGRIAEMVTRYDLPYPSQSVIVNAAHFQSDWRMQFILTATRPGAFTDSRGRQYPMPMMGQHLFHCSIFESEWGWAVGLPYKASRYSCWCFLPHEAIGMETFLGALTPSFWIEALAALNDNRSEIAVRIPRFHVSCAARLAAWLRSCGLARLFELSADYAPMGLTEGFTGDVLHNAFLLINETGTEAAAASMRPYIGGMPRPAPTVTFDRPFVCAIVDTELMHTLFAGVINAPEAADEPPAR